MNNINKPTMLLILDGFGLGKDPSKSAISQAKKPNLDEIFSLYPITTLHASSESVGLPKGQMGNSEVGHLNIGAGRVVFQDLSRISNEIVNGSFLANKELNQAMEYSIENNSTLHLLGLVSDGGVHSQFDHLLALLNMALSKGITNVSIHCFLDGRDVPPTSALKYIAELEEYLNVIGIGKISTIAGRYYGMDRDKRWERVALAYDAITAGSNPDTFLAKSSFEAIEMATQRKETDEFVKPTFIEGGFPILDNDSVIMFNFRPDRAREITRALVDENFDGFLRVKKPQNINFLCMTQYDITMPHVSVAYPPQSLKNTLGEYLSSLGLHQLRIAETEKYAHITFFFNGGVEKPALNEDRILIPSPKVATYDLMPEMSAYKVTERLLQELDLGSHDFIVLNFANPDMVGHTGNMSAAIKAIEVIDECVGKIVNKVLEKKGQLLLTADHGNADCMTDDEGNPMTAHSLNLVPLVNISKNPAGLNDGGSLCDIAPTLLAMMNIVIPSEMTGKSLLKSKVVL